MLDTKLTPRSKFMSKSMQDALGNTPRRHDVCIQITGVARPGKTAKDKETGATARNLANKRARCDWYDSQTATNATFPKDSCNGKKNRYIK